MATIFISFGALLVSLLSFSIASERLRLDLYNKRFDIYVRTVKMYQALMKSNEDEISDSLLADFILASREAQFLFGRNSGVYALLIRLNAASFTIINTPKILKDLPSEQKLQNYNEFTNALKLWNESIEPLEGSRIPSFTRTRRFR